MSIQSMGNHYKKSGKGHRKGELIQPQEYADGKTKQCFNDECDIVKIMARADRAGTMSHLEKYEGVFADFSDFDFREQTTKLSQGREIFDALPGELRQEFEQSPAKFFAYVNDPANVDDLKTKLPGLAAPGRQVARATPPTADETAAEMGGIAPPPEAPIVPPAAPGEPADPSD